MPSSDPTVERNKIGGEPNWVLEDEAPGCYAGSVPMVFLMQLLPDLEFETPQMEEGLDGSPEPAEEGMYELFIGNAVDLFGAVDRQPLVYAVPRSTEARRR